MLDASSGSAVQSLSGVGPSVVVGGAVQGPALDQSLIFYAFIAACCAGTLRTLWARVTVRLRMAAHDLGLHAHSTRTVHDAKME